MRRLLIIVSIVICAIFTVSAETKYVINGKDISTIKSEKTIKKDTITPYNTGWTFNGQPVYISKGGKGSAYIEKISKKTGKPYKQYLGKELTTKYKQLCGLPIE